MNKEKVSSYEWACMEAAISAYEWDLKNPVAGLPDDDELSKLVCLARIRAVLDLPNMKAE